MRGGIILIFGFWLLSGLWAYLKTRNHSTDATITALFIVSYPMVMIFAFQFKPLPSILVMPLIVSGIPWLLAGIHLNKILKDPSQSRLGEFVGFSAKYWGWLLGVSVLIPILLGK
mgnify:CR=1 FL=1